MTFIDRFNTFKLVSHDIYQTIYKFHLIDFMTTFTLGRFQGYVHIYIWSSYVFKLKNHKISELTIALAENFFVWKICFFMKKNNFQLKCEELSAHQENVCCVTTVFCIGTWFVCLLYFCRHGLPWYFCMVVIFVRNSVICGMFKCLAECWPDHSTHIPLLIFVINSLKSCKFHGILREFCYFAEFWFWLRNFENVIPHMRNFQK